MSYEPTLIIRKLDLTKKIKIIEEEQYSANEQTAKVANFLLQVSNYTTIKFGKLELIICEPEFTTFSKMVRDRLTELKIDFREDN